MCIKEVTCCLRVGCVLEVKCVCGGRGVCVGGVLSFGLSFNSLEESLRCVVSEFRFEWRFE